MCCLFYCIKYENDPSEKHFVHYGYKDWVFFSVKTPMPLIKPELLRR